MTITVQSNDPTPTQPAPEAPKPAEQVPETAAASSGGSAPEATTSEQEPTAASEPAETEEIEGEEGHKEQEAHAGDEASEGAETTEGTKEEKPGKKKGGFQRRIDKLNQRNSLAQQEIEYWKQQALKGAGATTNQAPVETKTATSEGKPDPSKFETQAEYVEALADWKTEQKLRERDQKLEQSRVKDEQAKLVQTYQERLNSFKAKTDDYEEVLENVSHVRISTAVETAIVKSENGPELLYELAKNPKEAERICRLPAIDAAIEMGKLQARIASKTSAPKTETKTTSSAPKPIATVGGGKAPVVHKSLDELARTDFQAYKRQREEELKNKRRRA